MLVYTVSNADRRLGVEREINQAARGVFTSYRGIQSNKPCKPRNSLPLSEAATHIPQKYVSRTPAYLNVSSEQLYTYRCASVFRGTRHGLRSFERAGVSGETEREKKRKPRGLLRGSVSLTILVLFFSFDLFLALLLYYAVVLVSFTLSCQSEATLRMTMLAGRCVSKKCLSCCSQNTSLMSLENRHKSFMTNPMCPCNLKKTRQKDGARHFQRSPYKEVHHRHHHVTGHLEVQRTLRSLPTWFSLSI